MRRLLGAGLSLGLLLASGASAQARVPHLIRYQGMVTDRARVPLEGPYTLTFRIYDRETGGAPLWQEIQPDVPVTRGSFSVLLGSVTALNLPFNAEMWLSIQVSNDPEMTPRIRLTSVPTAYRAEVAERLDDAQRLVPSGAIILWDGPSCPAGYTRVSALDGKFLAAGSTYRPAAGGSNTHTHGAGSYDGPSHSHNVTIPRTGWGQGPDTNGDLASSCNTCSGHNAKSVSGDRTLATTNGGGAVSGTSASADSRPEFATVLLCKKD